MRERERENKKSSLFCFLGPGVHHGKPFPPEMPHEVLSRAGACVMLVDV